MIPVIGALASAFGFTALLNWLLLDPTAHHVLRQRTRTTLIHTAQLALTALTLLWYAGAALLLLGLFLPGR